MEPIGVAYPSKERDRRKLHEATGGRFVIPPRHRGSVQRYCQRCHIPISVGPRLDASGLQIICVLCAHQLGIVGYA